MLSRRGFSLIEILVALVVLALLGGILVPQLVNRLGRAEGSTLVGNLGALVTALHNFKNDLGRYPSQLVHLTTQPTAAATDLCGRTIPNVTTAWRGPYLQRAIRPTGLQSGSSTIQNAVTRSPTSTGSPPPGFGELLVSVTDVDNEVWRTVEAHYDGDASATTGAVRFPSNTTVRGTLTFRIPIRGC